MPVVRKYLPGRAEPCAVARDPHRPGIGAPALVRVRIDLGSGQLIAAQAANLPW